MTKASERGTDARPPVTAGPAPQSPAAINADPKHISLVLEKYLRELRERSGG